MEVAIDGQLIDDFLLLVHLLHLDKHILNEVMLGQLRILLQFSQLLFGSGRLLQLLTDLVVGAH